MYPRNLRPPLPYIWMEEQVHSLSPRHTLSLPFSLPFLRALSGLSATNRLTTKPKQPQRRQAIDPPPHMFAIPVRDSESLMYLVARCPPHLVSCALPGYRAHGDRSAKGSGDKRRAKSWVNNKEVRAQFSSRAEVAPQA